MGTYDQRLGRYRTSSPLYRKGVSDILGIYKRTPFAIEVKSAKGQLSLEQKSFIKDFIDNGGMACVARGVEDVIKFLESIDTTIKTLYKA